MPDRSDITINEFLQFLEEKMKCNFLLIKENNEFVNKLRNVRYLSNKYQKEIEAFQSSNEELVNENNYMNHIHNSIISLFEKSKHYFEKIKKAPIDAQDHLKIVKHGHQSLAEGMSREECLEKTCTGEIPLNASHVYISDREFLKDLYSKCIDNEQYEKCVAIRNIINKL